MSDQTAGMVQVYADLPLSKFPPCVNFAGLKCSKIIRNVGTARLWSPESFVVCIRLFDGFFGCFLEGHL